MGPALYLDDDTAAFAHNAKGNMELGIRPMHLEVHTEPVQDGIPAVVKLVQDQGNFKILTLLMAGHILRAHVPEDQAIPSHEAWLRFPTRWTRLFADERLVKRQTN